MNYEEIARREQQGVDSVGQKMESSAALGLQTRLDEVRGQSAGLLEQRNISLLGVLDPRERARRIGETALIKGELAARTEILRMYHEAQISATREFFQHFLVKLRVKSRSELTSYVQEQLLLVEQKGNQITAQLENELIEQYARIEAMQVPQMRERRLKDFDVNMNRNFDLINKLYEDFRNAAERQSTL